MHFPLFISLASAALLCAIAGCDSLPESRSLSKELMPGDPNAPSQVTPDEAIAIAQSFVNHPWRPFATNIKHGNDKAGILVNTPDAGFSGQPERPGWWLPGEVNTGIPYKWGGYDDLASFDSAIASGLAGGDVSSPAKRRADNAAVSAYAAGVDCSGFVSRCLKLPRAHDTTQLPGICDELPTANDLRPGDLLNMPRRHVLLCAGWVTSDRRWIYFYETGGSPNHWKPGLKQAPIEALLALGYRPLRYRGMATETRTEGKQVLTRSVRMAADIVENPTIGEP